jgi:hypothetical protein
MLTVIALGSNTGKGVPLTGPGIGLFILVVIVVLVLYAIKRRRG